MLITLKNGESYSLSTLSDKMMACVGKMSDSQVFFLLSAFHNGGEDIRASRFTEVARQMGYEHVVFILEAIALLTDDVISKNHVNGIVTLLTPVISTTHTRAAAILHQHRDLI